MEDRAMEGIQVMGFQKTYPTVNLEMEKKNEKVYEYSILLLYTFETERGFKVKKIGKTTRNGTKVTYEVIKSGEEALKYKGLLERKVKEFNNKWDTKIKIS